MRSQPNRNYVSNDRVMTPPELAKAIVGYFKPQGKILEPCSGTGSFLNALPPGTLHCEIDEGTDFFKFHETVDWIVTNPPWSDIKNFLTHAMFLSSHVVFLLTVNHIWTKARIRAMRDAKFWIKDILLVDAPRTFPQTGFQLGAVHLQRGWDGPTKIESLPKGTYISATAEQQVIV